MRARTTFAKTWMTRRIFTTEILTRFRTLCFQANFSCPKPLPAQVVSRGEKSEKLEMTRSEGGKQRWHGLALNRGAAGTAAECMALGGWAGHKGGTAARPPPP